MAAALDAGVLTMTDEEKVAAIIAQSPGLRCVADPAEFLRVYLAGRQTGGHETTARPAPKGPASGPEN